MQEVINGFYKAAINDFKSARILYDNHQYSSAIFHTQQSIEKFSKAFGLLNGIVKLDKLKDDIGHNTEKIFRRPINKQLQEFNSYAKSDKLFPDFYRFSNGEEVIDLSNFSKELKKNLTPITHFNSEDFYYLTADEIDNILKNLESFKTKESITIEEVKEKYPSFFNSFAIGIKARTGRNILGKDVKENLEGNQVILNLFQQSLPYFLNLIKVYTNLFWLSLIMNAHNQTSRYPCLCCGEAPEDCYNKEADLVVKFNDIIKVLYDSFLKFEDIYAKNESSL